MRRLWQSNAVVFGVMTLLLAAPVLFFRDVPLYDLPNHIVRQEILFGVAPAATAPYYAPAWTLAPNQATEIWVEIFRHVVSVEWAVRLFLAVTVLQLFWGAIALNRALFGGHSRLTLAAALFAYSGPFLFGFVNLCFGLGMALWVVACWIKWRGRAWALPIFAALSCAILFAHLFAFGVYALVLTALTLDDLRQGLKRAQPALLAYLHLAVPVAVYLLAMPHAELKGSWVYLPMVTQLGMLNSAFGLYNPAIDMATLLLLLTPLLLGWRRLRFARPMLFPLIALGLAFLLLPHQLGEGTFVGYRMPMTLALFGAASLDWRAGERRRRVQVEAAIVMLFVARWAFMAAEWQYWQADFAEYHAAFAELPMGAKLLPISQDPNAIDPRAHPPLGHVDAFAVSERGALVPDLFAGLAHELMVYREPYNLVATQAPSPALAPNFDYVLLIRPDEIPAADIPPYREITRGRTFILGKLSP